MSEGNIYIIHRVLYVSAVWCPPIPSHDREDSNYSFSLFCCGSLVAEVTLNVVLSLLPLVLGLQIYMTAPGKNVAFLNKKTSSSKVGTRKKIAV